MNVPEQELTLDTNHLLQKYDPGRFRNRYFDLLLKENRKHNLVSRETSLEDLETLYAESLLPLERLPAISGKYLDIGSGGGFPAIPIMLASDKVATTLVERTHKKAGALRRILLELSLKAEIHAVAFVDADLDMNFDLITMRLVKLDKKMANSLNSILNSQGFLVYYSDFTENFSSFSSRTYRYKLRGSNKLKSFTVFTKN